ncbi:MAG: porin [Holosporales bacterium]|jgi:hypothetical protein|nr:porin [Holosporales bacterium]
MVLMYNKRPVSKFLVILTIVLIPIFAIAQQPQVDDQAQQSENDQNPNDDSHRDEVVTTKIGGQLQGMGFFGVGGLEKNTTQQQNVYFITSGGIDINATGASRNGLLYGATISLGVDAGQSATSVSTAYINLGNNCYGTAKIGTLSSSAASELSIDGISAILGGQEGVAGYLGGACTTCIGTNTSPYMPYEIQGASTISYSTPSVKGFTVGISYTPHNKMAGSKGKADTAGVAWQYDDGSAIPVAGNNLYPTVKNMFAGGVQYDYSDDVWHTTVSLVGWNGQDSLWSDGSTISQANKAKKLMAYQTGATFGYKDWTCGIGFLNLGDSLLNTTLSEQDGSMSGSDAGKVYTIGVSYVFDKWKFATAYMYTVTGFGRSQKATCHAFSYTVDYNYVSGLAFYGEFNHINTKTCEAALRYNEAFTTNKDASSKMETHGSFIVFGTRLSF